MKFLIHTIPERMWYVNKYLAPILKAGGAQYDIYSDIRHEGNLISTMRSFLYYGNDLMRGNTWHLQDDILFCRDFVRRCEDISDEWPVVCGTCYILDKNKLDKKTLKPSNMWWSFPCIRIDDTLAYECADWFFREARDDPKYTIKVMQGRYDDYFFKEFLCRFYPRMDILNVNPNLVDHIGCLLGGSSISNDTSSLGDRRAVGFVDEDLYEELRESLRKEGRL